MSFLDGLIRAGLAGYTGYQSGQAAGEALRLKRQQEEADRQREAQTAALRDALIQQQTEEAKARAMALLTPTPPPRHGRSIRMGADGGLYSVDEETGEATPVMYQGRHLRSRVPGTGASGTGNPAPNRIEQNDEAEGLTIGNTYLPQATAHALSEGFKAARAGGSRLSPGRLMKQVYEGLRRTRPDLFPQGTGGASSYDDFGGLPDGSPAGRSPTMPPTASTAGALPSGGKITVTRDEYDTIAEMQGADYATQHYVISGD